MDLKRGGDVLNSTGQAVLMVMELVCVCDDVLNPEIPGNLVNS